VPACAGFVSDYALEANKNYIHTNGTIKCLRKMRSI